MDKKQQDRIQIAAYGVGSARSDELQKAVIAAWTKIKNKPEELAAMASELQIDEAALKALESPPFTVETGKSAFIGAGIGEAILVFLGKVALGIAVKVSTDVLAPQARRVWDKYFVPKIKQITAGDAFGKDANEGT